MMLFAGFLLDIEPVHNFFTRKWDVPSYFDKKGGAGRVCLSHQEALAICRQSLSEIIAINSLLVGLPRVLWMV